MFFHNSRRSKDIDYDILTGWFHSRFKIRALKKGTDNPFPIAKDNLIPLTDDRLTRNTLKDFSLTGKVEPPFALKPIQILNGHQDPMIHLCHDVGIDIEVNNWKPPFDGSLQMAWKGTGIFPFLN